MFKKFNIDRNSVRYFLIHLTMEYSINTITFIFVSFIDFPRFVMPSEIDFKLKRQILFRNFKQTLCFRATLVHHLFRSILLFENILRNHQKPFAFDPLYRENIRITKRTRITAVKNDRRIPTNFLNAKKFITFLQKKKNYPKKVTKLTCNNYRHRRISFTKSRSYTKHV